MIFVPLEYTIKGENKGVENMGNGYISTSVSTQLHSVSRVTS